MHKPSQFIFTMWVLLSLVVLYPATRLLDGAFPIFTVIWIIVPAMAVWRVKDPTLAGFRAVPWRMFIKTVGINLGLLLALMLAFEPWSHTYRKLIDLVLSNNPPDTTFAWLLHYHRAAALGAMTLYSGLVTLFGEELFFRGWLMQLLQRRMRTGWAVVIQATLFMLPNLLAALALPPLQGILYAGVYAWLAIGVVGGWAAARTSSIWPSLVSATLCNLILVAVIL